MQLELRKMGNKYGVTLPKEVIAQLRVEERDTLTLVPSREGPGFQLTAACTEFEKQVRSARSSMERYRDTLRELAR